MPDRVIDEKRVERMLKLLNVGGSKTENKRAHAIPETIVPGTWEIGEHGDDSVVSIKAKKIIVPSGEDKRSAARRIHEYLHLKFSPLEIGPVKDDWDMEAIRVFEDIRVNYLGRLNEVDVKEAFSLEDAEKLKNSPIAEDEFLKMLTALSREDYVGKEEVWKNLGLSPFEKRQLYEIYTNICDNARNFDKVKQMAIDFATIFREIEEEKTKEKFKDVSSSSTTSPSGSEKKTPGTEGEKTEGEKAEDEKAEDETEDKKSGLDIIDLEELDREKKKRKFKKEDEKAKGKLRGKEGDEDALRVSGDMKIIENLPMSSKSVVRADKRTDIGYTLKHPERILTDKMCFSGKKKDKLIGVILVDMSGSMSINKKQLKRIVDKSAGATIAGYCGSGHEGYLYVLAKKGKLVREVPRLHSGNIVDYPALKWMIKEKKKMGGKSAGIWISDGSVTGIGDSHYDSIYRECFRLVKQERVLNLLNLDELEELLAKIGTK